MVKKAFLNDMMNENNLLCSLLQRESTCCAVLWEPDLLPNPCPLTQSLSLSVGVQGPIVGDDEGRRVVPLRHKDNNSSYDKEDPSCELTAHQIGISSHTRVESKNSRHVDGVSSVELLEILESEVDDLPVGLNIDAGPLACVACGILGYPFMAIVQPSEVATKELLPVNDEKLHEKLGKSGCSFEPPSMLSATSEFHQGSACFTYLM